MSNTTTQNAELFNNLIVEAQMAAYEQSVARQVATIFDVPTGSGTTVQVPVWDAVSADTLVEGTPATKKTTDTNAVTMALGEIGVYHQVTDFLRDSAFSNVAAQLGDASGRAIAEKMDANLFGLFSGLTGEAGPGAGAELTVEHIMKGVAVLRGRKVTGPFYAVVTPAQAYNLKKALTATTAYTANTNVGNSILSNYFVATIAGVTIIESPLLAVDGGDDAVGAVFTPAALGHGMRGTLTYEATRQAQNRATDLMVTAVAGQALIRPAFGIKLTADSAV